MMNGSWISTTKRQTDDKDPVRVFRYRLRYRVPLSIVFGYGLLFNLLSLALVALIIFRMVTGSEILSETGTSDPGMLVAFTIGPPFMVFIATTVLLMFPDIHVSADGFRISRLVYTSPWLWWHEIRDIETHRRTNRFQEVKAVTVERIADVYRFVGFVEGIGAKGFLIRSNIEEYDALMALFRQHRPDLFE